MIALAAARVHGGPGACGHRQAVDDAAHARRQARSAGQLDQRDADAARTAEGTRRSSMSEGTGREAGEGLRRPRRAAGRKTATRIVPRRRRVATVRPARPARSAATTTSGSIPAIASRSSTASTASSLIVDPPNGRGPGADARGAAARAGAAGDGERTRPVRPSRAAAAGRALPDVVRLERRAADAAELLLQQQLPDRADQGSHDDPGRDGARRPRHPDRRRTAAQDACVRGWAIRSAAGKATRWWWKPPTSTRCRCSAALRKTSR